METDSPAPASKRKVVVTEEEIIGRMGLEKGEKLAEALRRRDRSPESLQLLAELKEIICAERKAARRVVAAAIEVDRTLEQAEAEASVILSMGNPPVSDHAGGNKSDPLSDTHPIPVASAETKPMPALRQEEPAKPVTGTAPKKSTSEAAGDLLHEFLTRKKR